MISMQILNECLKYNTDKGGGIGYGLNYLIPTVSGNGAN